MSRLLVLALGNDLLADDAAALVAARRLRALLPPQVVVREAGEVGMALLEELVGFEAALILDTVQTGSPPGTVHRFGLESLAPVVAPSPHWAGLPEVKAWAEALGLPFPQEVVVLALEAEDLSTLGGPLTPAVAAGVEELVRQALAEVAVLGQSQTPQVHYPL
ncbi:MAG: hydrogenase maturation protease [Thermoanaerobaculum sp.]|nr:hydrogenase maturation protease [Thermoanaerobaculum sp.]MCX7894982.1 hydrogenase maturation protease [Thermoanaerobaculum sp.]MDW7967548.1 hydrogenase maturation protease [Thermoanaerobaculum sp.]